MQTLEADKSSKMKVSNNNSRKPLKSISNRKRQRSPSADNDKKCKKQNISLIEPPRKKQKTASKKSSKSSSKTKSKTKSKGKRKSCSDKKEEEDDEEIHFLTNYIRKSIVIKRVFDNERFDDEYDDDDDDDDKERNLKFIVMTKDDKPSYVRLNDIISNGFKYNSSSNPTAFATKKQYLNDLQLFLKRNCIQDRLDTFYTKLNGKYFISEKGFCILMMIIKDFDQINQNVQHWCYHRYYYRKQLFGTKITGINMKKPQSIDNMEICTVCCLEDIENNFYFNNPCDCQCVLHLKCNKMSSFQVPNDDKTSNDDWFCPFCTEYLDINRLKERRDYFRKSGDFEVEAVIDYDIIDDEYIVKWKNYPNQAICKTDLSLSFIESVNEFWKKERNGKIPKKAKIGINKLKEEEDDDIDIDIKMGNLDINNDDDNDNKNDNDNDNDKDKEKDMNDIFIPAQLHDIMRKEFIIRRQKYTQQTYQRYKETVDKYQKWLQKEVKNETKLGLEIKHEMIMKQSLLLPKYHLRSINNDWDCSLPRINDIIQEFLRRKWSEWKYNVSSESFVIGEIIDPENPAKKYGVDQGVHQHKAYGLFAIKLILKDTLLFEYAGCVKPIGTASKKLDHLETELDQTTLFDLIGHLDSDRSKLFWGKKPNDQLVIDPSKYHNEGVYMNDYRDRVMDDPDEDDLDDDDNDGNDDEDDVQITDNHERKQNVKFYEVLVNNWPRVFAVAIDDIQPGQELLGDYGQDFWSNFRLMMRRQTQLNEIKEKLKQKINMEWKMKYNELKLKCQKQENQIKQLKQKLNE